MKSFIAKRVNSILVNLRYLRFKLLKYKENNKKMCNTFDHNFKNIMRKVSLERNYLVLYDGALTLKMSKMALNSFCDKTLHINFLNQEIPSVLLSKVGATIMCMLCRFYKRGFLEALSETNEPHTKFTVYQWSTVAVSSWMRLNQMTNNFFNFIK